MNMFLEGLLIYLASSLIIMGISALPALCYYRRIRANHWDIHLPAEFVPCFKYFLLPLLRWRFAQAFWTSSMLMAHCDYDDGPYTIQVGRQLINVPGPKEN